MLSEEHTHIIAIGASEGGLEEINSFFDNTPLDGVSYVVVPHLSPDFKSRMASIIAKHSKLVVKDVKNEMKVQSNEIYVIPGNKVMTIKDKRLYLTNKRKDPDAQVTIDTFLKSLAADHGRKAIAVILSGQGSDGTEGIKAIKNAGGMVIASNPNKAEHGGMPLNAISTGLVDYVLQPALIPRTIKEFVEHEASILIESEGGKNTVAAILSVIHEQLALDVSHYNQATILRRIKRRVAANHFENVEMYLEFLKAHPDEVETLAKNFFTCITSFFRNEEAFNVIQSNILPGLLNQLTPGEELRLWVPGCATGEEAYSLAMLIREQLSGKFEGTVVKIFATDIDEGSLNFADKGIYPSIIAREVSLKRLREHFLHEGEYYRVKPELRKMVIFAQHDLANNPPYSRLHFISCRNVLMYMNPQLQAKVFSLLIFGLKKDGYLFLGSNEKPMPLRLKLDVVDKKHKIYKDPGLKKVPLTEVLSLPKLGYKKSKRPLLSPEYPSHDTNNVTEAVNLELVSHHECFVCCIDQNDTVVKFYGDISKYLLHKNFNRNLSELLPKSLATAFTILKRRALKTTERITLGGINIIRGGSKLKVKLSIKQFHARKGDQALLVVIIAEDTRIYTSGDYKVYDETYVDQYTADLENEVNDLNEMIHTLHKKLDASNQYIQSFM